METNDTTVSKLYTQSLTVSFSQMDVRFQSVFSSFSRFAKTLVTWIFIFGVLVNANQKVMDTALTLKLNKVTSHSAEFEINGLGINVFKYCDLYYCQIENTLKKSVQLILTHKNVTLHDLRANQTYTASILCKHTGNNGTQISSPWLNFSTIATGENQLQASLSSTRHMVPTTQVSFSSTRKRTIIYNTVTVYQDSAPLDIALGLIFGVIGLAVIGIALYHLIKKQRRSMRRRRLLNRNQENDIFPDPDDYGAAL